MKKENLILNNLKVLFIFYNLLAIPVIKVIETILILINSEFRERQSLSKHQLNNNIDLNKNLKNIWFHSSSLGEFEQAIPIIEKLKNDNQFNIIVSFFSPSGYFPRKDYNLADDICFLPLDYFSNVKKFHKKYKIDLAVFVRYDFWFNFIYYIKSKEIPIYLINATIPKSNFKNLPFIHFFYREIFKIFDKIFTIDELSFKYFSNLNQNVSILPDSRYDRILNKVNDFDNTLKFNNLVLVAGSTWEEDEKIIIDANLKDIKLIIVPHKVEMQKCVELKNKFNNSILFSELNGNLELIDKYNVIIVDSIGNLMKMYSIADIAYVGGAFGNGLHSISEPAGFGLPIICGNYKNESIDSKKMFESGTLIKVNNSNELNLALDKVKEEKYRLSIGNQSKNYILNNSGSSEIIAIEIKNKLTFNSIQKF